MSSAVYMCMYPCNYMCAYIHRFGCLNVINIIIYMYYNKLRYNTLLFIHGMLSEIVMFLLILILFQ